MELHPHTQPLPRAPLPEVSQPPYTGRPVRVQPPCPPSRQLCSALLPRPTPQVRVCVPYTAGSQAPHTRGKPGWPGSWHSPLQAQGLCTCYSQARGLLCPPTTPSRLVISMSGQPLQPAVPPTHTHKHTHTHSLTAVSLFTEGPAALGHGRPCPSWKSDLHLCD